ncbi:MAG: DUF2924 domain-containing protein [Verrucomicrobiota bacterium]
MTSINELQHLAKVELLARWHKLPGGQPPPSRVDRLTRELAYREQERDHGRLDKNTSVSLRRHMTEFEKFLVSGIPRIPFKTPSRIRLETGAVLTRQWEGQTITVQTLGTKHFEFEGRKFKSLSAIAKAITGQHLSGPLFFGLKEVANG